MDPIGFILRVVLGVLPVMMSLPAGAADITGTVRSAATQAALPGALVSLQATGVRTTADANGHFSLPAPAGSNLGVTAAQKGYYTRELRVNAPDSGIDFALEAVPASNHADYQLLDPKTCAICHPNQHSQWRNTAMANAGLNTWVHDTYSGKGTEGGMGGFVYLLDSAFAHRNPASECASCHQPESWVAQPFSALQDPSPTPSPAVAHGVSCEVCHKVANVDTARINFPGLFPGAVEFTRPANASQQVQYGVQGDVSFEADGMMRASYQPQLVAELCAACHQDATDLTGDHTYTGPISEGTYLEWKESPYADPVSPHFATCVTCHMPSTTNTLMCVVGLPRDPGTLRSHTIEGTTPEFLENALDLTLNAGVEQGRLRVRVDVLNSRTGHHVPSGVTIRNVILLVEAVRQQDQLPLTSVGTQTVHELGGVGDPQNGNYAGLPGKLYAKVIHDANGQFPTFFTDATGFVFDNRIAPLATDHTDYEFLLPPGGGILRVQARLIYRRAFRALVEAKQWRTDGHGHRLADVTAPHFGQLMESADYSVAVAALTIASSVSGDEVILSWPMSIDQPVEQSLNPGGPWSVLAPPYEPDGGQWQLRLPSLGTERYFRLAPTAAGVTP